MVPTVLTLHTADGLHELACLPGACIEVGTDAACEIVLEGSEILPRHCSLTRTGEQRFRIQQLDKAAKFSVNGVEAPELEVEVPFQFGISGETITFDLVFEETGEELPTSSELPFASASGEDEARGALRAGRRDYLLHPLSVRPRVSENVGEVRLEAKPEIFPEGTGPEMPPDELPPSVDHEEESSDTAQDVPSSRVLFAGLVFCGLMIGATYHWQRFLDTLPEAEKSPQVVETAKELSDEDFLRAGMALYRAGLSTHAVQMLRWSTELHTEQAAHALSLAKIESGDFSEDPVGVLRRLAGEGSRRALSDLVIVVDSPLNPARHLAESVEHLEFAANLGETAAWMPLGERQEQGLGVEKDLNAALASYKRARDGGDVRAEAKVAAEHDALDCVAVFVRSWNEVSVTAVLDQLSAAPRRYFEQDEPGLETVLRMEERLRALWPLRRISVAEGAVATLRSFEVVEVKQPFQFELQRGVRIARGRGMLTCEVRRADDGWRVGSAADEIALNELLPAPDQFVTAMSLRLLAPAFTMEEQMEEARLEILDRMRGLENTKDFKPALTLVLDTAMTFPKEDFWRPFADKLCDRMARELFSQGKWLDAAWAAPVHQLSELGAVSAMLLEGHLLMAGYGYSRDDRRGAALYQKAFDAGKRADARFYYAEALFQGRGVMQDIDKAGALALSFMSRSKHPMEAYLAAHLLWRKAEVDPSLWQDVYDTLSRVADRHAPAKHLAAMVLLNHGNTTRERKTGFAALQAAAEEGVPEAMKNLAKCYQDGVGCEKDPQAAILWKQKAAVTEPPRRRHYTEFEE
ncbi:MAG: hypothetical protein R3F13_17330 [Prosthecobacter sp.]